MCEKLRILSGLSFYFYTVYQETKGKKRKEKLILNCNQFILIRSCVYAFSYNSFSMITKSFCFFFFVLLFSFYSVFSRILTLQVFKINLVKGLKIMPFQHKDRVKRMCKGTEKQRNKAMGLIYCKENACYFFLLPSLVTGRAFVSFVLIFLFFIWFSLIVAWTEQTHTFFSIVECTCFWRSLYPRWCVMASEYEKLRRRLNGTSVVIKGKNEATNLGTLTLIYHVNWSKPFVNYKL